jgi:hypothetical protein
MGDPHYRKASLSGSGAPTSVEAKFVGQIYIDTDSGTTYVSYGLAAGEWNSILIRGEASATKAITPMSNVMGYMEVGVNEGLVYYLQASVTVSSTSDADVELGDADFSGSPNILYEIGYEDGGDPLWDPTADGNWVDRNAFGVLGLTDGKLYYRLTNNGPNTISMTLEVRILGVK